MRFLGAIWRGIKWLFLACVIFVSTHWKDAVDIVKHIKDLIELIQDTDFPGILNWTLAFWNKITTYELIFVGAVVGAVSLIVYGIYTRPRDDAVDQYYDRLERRRPGTTSRLRRKKRR